MRVAIVRGKFLNNYEMQVMSPLMSKYSITGFGSLHPMHKSFSFPIVNLPSPMDIYEVPLKMQVLNRIFVDAHYLFGLEKQLIGYDIAHSAETYYHYTQQCLNAKKKGYIKKVIATVLENIPFNNEGIRGRKEFKKRARNELDHIIALTANAKQALIMEGADEKKITVIGSAINKDIFKPVNIQRKLSDGKVTILFVGRIETYKGVYDVVYAIKMLLMDRSLNPYKIQLKLIGMGTEENNLRSLIKRLHLERNTTITHIPYNIMPKEYANADIFVAPSRPIQTWQEQYGYTLLEAQSCGLPIVTTATGAIPENVGNAALIVRPGDFLEIGNAIRSFILNPKKRYEYARRARKRAEEVHDVKIVAKKIAEVYQKVLLS